MREKLLSFLGQLGKECRVSKTGSKILETLWDLARYSGLPCHLVERALDEHLSVLAEIPNKEQLRKTYVLRCIDDLKKRQSGNFSFYTCTRGMFNFKTPAFLYAGYSSLASPFVERSSKHG